MCISHMAQISDGAETYLRQLEAEFYLEIANRDIGASGATYRYASGADARLAMLRLAYLKGREDEREPFDKRDFEADVARVRAANQAKR